MYTLEEFAELTGLSKDTLRKYDELLNPLRTPGGHRRYTEEHLKKLYKLGKLEQKFTVIYARVSTKSQVKHLENQIQFCEQFCKLQGYTNVKIIRDVGSSVNFNRKGLRELLRLVCNGLAERVVIASRDRLARVGFSVIQTVCELHDVELIVISEIDNQDSVKDIVEELVHLVHYYAMRLYGARSYRRIAELERNILETLGCSDEKDNADPSSQNQS